MKTLLSIDPGVTTGWSRWQYGLEDPLERVDWGVIRNGVEGFVQWWGRLPAGYVDIIVFEQFVLGDDFVNDRTMQASKIEGALLMGVMPGFPLIFQRRVDKRAVPDWVLKRHGLWLTGSQVGHEDGRDVNDSQIHALAWGKRHHLPSLERYFGADLALD
jgi:hypothetical protein